MHTLRSFILIYGIYFIHQLGFTGLTWYREQVFFIVYGTCTSEKEVVLRLESRAFNPSVLAVFEGALHHHLLLDLFPRSASTFNTSGHVLEVLHYRSQSAFVAHGKATDSAKASHPFKPIPLTFAANPSAVTDPTTKAFFEKVHTLHDFKGDVGKLLHREASGL